MNIVRIPTGIDSLDHILRGGFPSGSLILLLGEIGAGDFEFAFTSSIRLLKKGSENGDTKIRKVSYISLTRSKEDVFKEIAFSFPDYYNILQKSDSQNTFEFKDFSEAYFARSFLPATWRRTSNKELTFDSLKWNEDQKNLIVTMLDHLDKKAKGNLVIIDSLTALAQYSLERMKWNDLILFLRGLQKVSKMWDGLVYIVLSEGIFNRSQQEEISECMDGVMFFGWEKLGPSQRQRIMYIKKFRGVLPQLDQDNIVNFETQINSQQGFEVSNIKRVRGI